MPRRTLRIATFNVNGIRTRLPHLLQWLAKEQPDVACLQELKATDAAFPAQELEAAGYGALWAGQRAWNGVAVLARGAEPLEIRRRLPGDRSDDQSRYLEVAAHGVVVGCLYLPNGNPQPGPKFDYKLRWFERLHAHAQTLVDCGHPVVLAGDYNVVPIDLDIYDPKHWRRDALLQPESREAYARLLDQGWTDALRALHPDARIYTFWDYFRQQRRKRVSPRRSVPPENASLKSLHRARRRNGAGRSHTTHGASGPRVQRWRAAPLNLPASFRVPPKCNTAQASRPRRCRSLSTTGSCRRRPRRRRGRLLPFHRDRGAAPTAAAAGGYR